MATFGGLAAMNAAEMPGDKLRMLLYGAPGTGKTYLASSIALLGPTLFIDFAGEKGVRSFKGTPWEKNITVVRPTTITDMEALYKALVQPGQPYKALVIDSLTAAQKLAMRFIVGANEDAISEIQRGRRGPDMQAWGQLLEIMTDVAVYWYALADGDRANPIHVVMTAQAKTFEDEEGTERLYPDVSKGSRSIVTATPDYVGYCDYEDDGEMKHVLRIGPDLARVTKARIPPPLRGKIPDTLGLSSPLTLDKFVSVMQIPK